MVITYICYEELFGRRATVDKLIGSLKEFRQSSMLAALMAINVRLHDRFGYIEYQTQLTATLLRDSRIRPRISTTQSVLLLGRVIAHRQQLLYVMKLTLLHCAEDSPDLPSNLDGLGYILLIANDLLHCPYPPPATLKEKALQGAASFFSVQEAAGVHAFENKVLRSRWMLSRSLNALRGSTPFFDIPQLFESHTGVSLEVFQALCFGAATKFLVYPEHAQPLQLNLSWFRSTTVAPETVEAFLGLISATSAEMSKHLTSTTNVNDFTAFRDKPFLRYNSELFVLDIIFFLEKFETCPFWTCRKPMEDKEALLLFSFWGRLFEQYISEVLYDARSESNVVIPRPIFTNSEELCDVAVVCGDSLLLIEAKSATLSAQAKYGRNLDYLDRKLREIFYHSDRPQAVKQLASSLERALLQGEKVFGLDFSKISRIFPVLVTRDDVGEIAGIPILLNQMFQERKNTLDLRRSGKKIAPLTVMSAETLENLTAYTQTVPLSDVIGAYSHSTGVKAPFSLTTNEVLLGNRDNRAPNVLNPVLEAFGRMATERLGLSEES